MMSGDIASGSCPTYEIVDIERKEEKVTKIDKESSANIALYAVVDKTKKKKKLPEIDRESSADIPLYAVVDKTQKKVLSQEIHQKYNENDYSDVELEYTASHATGKEEPQHIYSVLEQNEASEVVLSKTSASFNCFGDKDKTHETARSNYHLGLMIVLCISFLVLVVVINAGVSYAMIALTEEPRLFQNKTYNNSFQLTAAMKDIESINTSFFELVSLINKSTLLSYVSLENRIKFIEDAMFGRNRLFPAPSCQVIHKFQPSSSSGYYWVKSSNGSSVCVYCDMTKTCGSVTGGLTRVAILNNETRPQLCTGNFWSIAKNRRCIRSTEEPGCSHIVFPVMNIAFSHICGTVEAFWFGTPDGFTGSNRSSSTTVNDNYVDGISLTYGNTSNRIHIWTFVADGHECVQNCPRAVPQYVGNYSNCLYYQHQDSCTPRNSLNSTFIRQFQQPVTESIEVRVCRDQPRRRGSNQEGIFLGNLEIYVW